MKRGDVYLCPLGRRDDAGQEILVPVVVLTRDAINQYGPVVLVAPIVETDPAMRPYPSDVVVRAPEGGLTVDGLILTMQLRAVPRVRLHHLLGTLSSNAVTEVDRALRITLDLEEC
jgi:mRNA interferase MazF